MSFDGVDGAYLDFGIEWRNVAVQCDFFPADLVKLAREIGLGLELSQSPPQDEEDEIEPSSA